jgi:hypothetical protein
MGGDFFCFFQMGRVGSERLGKGFEEGYGEEF